MRPLPGRLVFAEGLSSFVLPVQREVRLPDNAESERFETFLEGPCLRFREALAVHVRDGRAARPLDRAIDDLRRCPFKRVRREEMAERDAALQREVRMPWDVVTAAAADADRARDQPEPQQGACH